MIAQRAPLEITIDVNGVITALDNKFLIAQRDTLQGEVSMVRTSLIELDPEEQLFYIQLVKRDLPVGMGYLTFLEKNPPPGYDPRYWGQECRVNLYDRESRLLFPTYEMAVEFEKWLIPALRNVYGPNYC